MRTGGITKRWIMNTLSVIVMILIIVNVCASVFIKRYYYEMAENTIDSKVQRTAVQSFFPALKSGFCWASRKARSCL